MSKFQIEGIKNKKQMSNGQLQKYLIPTYIKSYCENLKQKVSFHYTKINKYFIKNQIQISPTKVKPCKIFISWLLLLLFFLTISSFRILFLLILRLLAFKISLQYYYLLLVLYWWTKYYSNRIINRIKYDTRRYFAPFSFSTFEITVTLSKAKGSLLLLLTWFITIKSCWSFVHFVCISWHSIWLKGSVTLQVNICWYMLNDFISF